ncbi:acetyl-CoA C-acetyltransferase [Mycolicibacterium phlei]|uniref:acetyl-CoA C-acetyltransferase n=1 Tax=Mycolicibacterium phlei TaxID=1771 RepID=UPI00025ADEE0|nr:acetyl-CoA C-acetyltransferase [Mycolicibacterium phlei]EID11762.1 acetyl-CoA acetyltransferase [Mycolicibacterium phlei RIVM601174]MBF4193887.1 acetyl-CoA acetyltransferase [Mycolicibacterium phlei]
MTGSHDAVIVATARTPIGRAYKGSLTTERADDLCVSAINAAVQQVPQLDPSTANDLIVGCGAPGGEQGFNMARVVAVLLGWDTVPGTTVTRYCASSLQGIRMAMHAIRAGEGHTFVVAGAETVSRSRLGTSDSPPVLDDTDPRDRSANPWVNPKFAAAQAVTRSRATAKTTPPWSDPRERGELPDVYIAMGQTAENVAQLDGVSREDQDAYAALSQQRAERAIAEGFWAREITPYTRADGTVVDADDCPRAGTTVEKLATLKPVFRADGTVTAGNACPLNDGAAAVIVMSSERARRLGITPLARIVATGATGLSPEVMGLGPVESTRQALEFAGMSLSDVDQFEINEAFAAQVLASQRRLGIDIDRLNVNGGAIAVGHPFGMTGARIAGTLINSLRWHDALIGVETMCVGGGQGMAMMLERLAD